MCFNPHIDDRDLIMKKEYESNIVLRSDNNETLRIARNNEDSNFTIGTDEDVIFTFEMDEAGFIIDAINEVVFGKKSNED